MLALVAAPPTAEIREVSDPQPARNQALVDVRAFSLNRGEVRRLADMQDGELPGGDAAGVLREPAADGSGPKEGARVVGMMGRGAWAQLANVPTTWLPGAPQRGPLRQGHPPPAAR